MDKINYEEYLLASLITGDLASYKKAVEILKPEYFTDRHYKSLWNIIVAINREGIDLVEPIAILERINTDDKITKQDKLQLAFTLQELVSERFIGLPKFDYYLHKFMEDVRRRQLRLLGKTLTENKIIDVSGYIDELIAKLTAIRKINA